jgi:hypothetical protein
MCYNSARAQTVLRVAKASAFEEKPMTRSVRLLAFASFTILGTCVLPSAGPLSQFADARGRQCFRANEVYGYSRAEDGFVDVRTGQGPFRLRLNPGCPDFSVIMQIGVRPMDSSWLCEGKDEVLIAPNRTGNNRCPISDISAVRA